MRKEARIFEGIIYGIWSGVCVAYLIFALGRISNPWLSLLALGSGTIVGTVLCIREVRHWNTGQPVQEDPENTGRDILWTMLLVTGLSIASQAVLSQEQIELVIIAIATMFAIIMGYFALRMLFNG
jgi:hypothetical protein